MTSQSRFSGRVFVRVVPIVLAAGAVAFLLGACSDSDSTENCWVGVDTVYVSNMAVTDTVGVRAVFEAYVDSVETAGGNLWGGGTAWEYVGSRFDWEWQGRRYWAVTHSVLFPQTTRVIRRTLEVDENGVLVQPLGCI